MGHLLHEDVNLVYQTWLDATLTMDYGWESSPERLLDGVAVNVDRSHAGDIFVEILAEQESRPTDLECLRELAPEIVQLDIDARSVTDISLVSQMGRLRHLNISSARVSRALPPAPSKNLKSFDGKWTPAIASALRGVDLDVVQVRGATNEGITGLSEVGARILMLSSPQIALDKGLWLPRNVESVFIYGNSRNVVDVSSSGSRWSKLKRLELEGVTIAGKFSAPESGFSPASVVLKRIRNFAEGESIWNLSKSDLFIEPDGVLRHAPEWMLEAWSFRPNRWFARTVIPRIWMELEDAEFSANFPLTLDTQA